MRIEFTVDEKRLMDSRKISYHDGEYSEDEALNLLEDLHDVEIYFAMNGDDASRKMAGRYARLADKVQELIP